LLAEESCIGKDAGKRGTYGELFSDQNFRKTVRFFTLNVGRQLTGMNFFIMYSITVFERLHYNGITLNLVIAFTNLAGLWVMTWLYNKKGRVFNLKYGALGQAFSLFVIFYL
jgi:hypothetical protein